MLIGAASTAWAMPTVAFQLCAQRRIAALSSKLRLPPVCPRVKGLKHFFDTRFFQTPLRSRSFGKFVPEIAGDGGPGIARSTPEPIRDLRIPVHADGRCLMGARWSWICIQDQVYGDIHPRKHVTPSSRLSETNVPGAHVGDMYPGRSGGLKSGPNGRLDIPLPIQLQSEPFVVLLQLHKLLKGDVLTRRCVHDYFPALI